MGPERSQQRPGKGDRTRRRILDAAAKVLATAGTTGVSLSDVARAAGIKAGSLYFHFGSKDELVAEVLAVGIDEAIAHLDKAVDSAGPSAATRMSAAIHAHFDARLELNDYAAVVLSVGEGSKQLVNGRYERQRRRYAAYWLELIAEAQAAGDLPQDVEPRLVRELCFGAMNAELRGRWTATDAAHALVTLLGLA